ncbi:hypothetical protein D8674_016906 [Pyrus ussuriensis x Pyrus communis]|uniref:Uncharacterized protein n=1 Tax=Pyrus ussuriensis x Pyrus communis TaxID=2448454 RepID=A0A5N5HB49_9ROSA|nr:hypothetical protein D8674_016906 [Pyrus ussuriensis x Pyrus communis]
MKFWVCKGTPGKEGGWRKSDDRQRKCMKPETETSSRKGGDQAQKFETKLKYKQKGRREGEKERRRRKEKEGGCHRHPSQRLGSGAKVLPQFVFTER